MTVRIGELISDVSAPAADHAESGPRVPVQPATTVPQLDEATIELIVQRVLKRLQREWDH
jgi:hypothetical protein